MSGSIQPIIISPVGVHTRSNHTNDLLCVPRVYAYIICCDIWAGLLDLFTIPFSSATAMQNGDCTKESNEPKHVLITIRLIEDNSSSGMQEKPIKVNDQRCELLHDQNP